MQLIRTAVLCAFVADRTPADVTTSLPCNNLSITVLCRFCNEDSRFQIVKTTVLWYDEFTYNTVMVQQRRCYDYEEEKAFGTFSDNAAGAGHCVWLW